MSLQYIVECLKGFALREFSMTFSLATIVDGLKSGKSSSKIHCTGVFALRNGKFSMLGVYSPYAPISFVFAKFHFSLVSK